MSRLTPQSVIAPDLAKRRKTAETLASIGMILIAVGAFLPLLDLTSTAMLTYFKWVFAAGALMYWGARCIPVNAEDENLRIKRLRRIEFWAGACFGVATFFWFYNEQKFGGDPHVGSLTILKTPILFTMAGAVLQIVTAWMIYFVQQKLRNQEPESDK